MTNKAKHSLISAYLKLLEEKEFSKITVTNLAEECGISRQTFYYHFDGIKEMIDWALKTDIKKICSVQAENNWKDGKLICTDFFDKYDLLFRSAANSTEFITVYNMLCDSLYLYISSYLSQKSKNGSTLFGDYDFLINCMTSCLAGMVVKEIGKEESNYEALIKKLYESLNYLQNNQ